MTSIRSLMSGDFVGFFFGIFVRLIVVFTALPIHEFAHGFVANKMGDPTAKNQGRLTLNPLTHFDLIGTTALLLTGFGWAKPVPVNPFFFKNRKKGMALTALAGPVSNILLATVCLLLWKIIVYFVPAAVVTGGFFVILLDALSLMTSINLGLAVFNLLPIPPLDGSRVLAYFLPNHITDMMYQYERIITLAVFALLMFTNVLSVPLNFLRSLLFSGINFITGFVELIARLL